MLSVLWYAVSFFDVFAPHNKIKPSFYVFNALVSPTIDFKERFYWVYGLLSSSMCWRQTGISRTKQRVCDFDLARNDSTTWACFITQNDKHTTITCNVHCCFWAIDANKTMNYLHSRVDKQSINRNQNSNTFIILINLVNFTQAMRNYNFNTEFQWIHQSNISSALMDFFVAKLSSSCWKKKSS